MENLSKFISDNLAKLIAPAGHGKTTAIADYLLLCGNGSCQLVLTHTHAGIASLRKKFTHKNVPTDRYQLDTITGFAQKYVLGFCGDKALPDEEAKDYFDEAVNKCTEILRRPLVQKVITSTYQGIIVDEYQDCTQDQHQMIMALAENLPLHILGDPLQGIFSFEKKPMVDFNSDLGFFIEHRFLATPWRWENTNPVLGQSIYNMRLALERGQIVPLQDNVNGGIRVYHHENVNEYDQEYLNWLRQLIKFHETASTHILMPTYYEKNEYGVNRLRGDVNDRISLKTQFDFRNEYEILDAIDSSEYYSLAKRADTFLMKCRQGSRLKRIQHIFDLVIDMRFTKGSVGKWIKRTENRLIDRNKFKNESRTLEELMDAFETRLSMESFYNLIRYLSNLPEMKCYHWGVKNSFLRSLRYATLQNCTIFEAMKHLKSMIRHQGRKIEGKCIGTTLLTKGLEFDTVIILYPERFEDKKNFYVAISRACKKLVMITQKESIQLN